MHFDSDFENMTNFSMSQLSHQTHDWCVLHVHLDSTDIPSPVQCPLACTTHAIQNNSFEAHQWMPFLTEQFKWFIEHPLLSILFMCTNVCWVIHSMKWIDNFCECWHSTVAFPKKEVMIGCLNDSGRRCWLSFAGPVEAVWSIFQGVAWSKSLAVEAFDVAFACQWT